MKEEESMYEEIKKKHVNQFLYLMQNVILFYSVWDRFLSCSSIILWKKNTVLMHMVFALITLVNILLLLKLLPHLKIMKRKNENLKTKNK